jgi:transposase
MIEWEHIPDQQFDAWQHRLEIVELILDGTIDAQTKREEKLRYCEEHRVSERTLANYVRRYREKGPQGLLFYHRRKPSPRIHDAQLREKILEMIEEIPARSVPKLRRLLNETEEFRDRISQISDRSVYRFLVEHGLGYRERQHLSGEISRRAYRQFEAAYSLALVQGDARDGIWLPGADGKPYKTYLFVWLDDYSRKILYGRYYTSEKLPCMEDSFKYMVLRWGIPLVVYVDNGKVYISRHFASILAELSIRQLRHKPYQAHAKGKVVMRTQGGY